VASAREVGQVFLGGLNHLKQRGAILADVFRLNAVI
jgi:hypothetical protein